MKKSTKILAGVSAISLIIILLWFANGLLGNPISKMMANNTSKGYIAKNYPNMELNISGASYSFKTGDYYVEVKSPTSKDTHFSLTISPFGKIIGDSYDNNVLDKYNTLYRIDLAYRSKVKEVFEEEDFPYKSDIYFGDIKDKESVEVSEDDEYSYPNYGLDREKLELDKDYNIYEVGKKAGHIVFYAEDEDISIKRTSEILLDIKDILDKENISFYAIDFSLEKPRSEDGLSNSDDTSIKVEEFLYKDIYKEDLDKRISKAHEDLQKYYEKQDLEKEKLLSE